MLDVDTVVEKEMYQNVNCCWHLLRLMFVSWLASNPQAVE